VEDDMDYLRFGNVKISNQLLKLPDQEEPLLKNFIEKYSFPADILFYKTLSNIAMLVPH
jgi:hypothetical protein